MLIERGGIDLGPQFQIPVVADDIHDVLTFGCLRVRPLIVSTLGTLSPPMGGIGCREMVAKARRALLLTLLVLVLPAVTEFPVSAGTFEARWTLAVARVLG